MLVQFALKIKPGIVSNDENSKMFGFYIDTVSEWCYTNYSDTMSE